MKLVLLFVVAVASAIPTASNVSDEQWQDFKQLYNKDYTPDEDAQRRSIFESNVAYMEQHNMEAANGDHSFTMGYNAYSDYSADEINSIMNGLTIQVKQDKMMRPMFRSDKELKDLPNSINWKEQGYVTAVKDQAMCGSCWAFSATGSLEGQNFAKTGKLVSLSEQQLVDCDKIDHGCFGGLMDNAFTYIKQNKGIDTEASYPYQARPGKKCLYTETNKGATVSGFKDIPRNSEADLQKAVAEVGPISVGIDASRPTFHNYKSGVYLDPECSSTRLDHGVLVVGYGTEDGKDYWLVKNSWGKTWGMEGYIKMARNKNNACGIATQASYPVV